MSDISAPAKIILFGEHAVVYGHPAIAVPVSSLRAVAAITPGSSEFQVILKDTGQQFRLLREQSEINDSLDTMMHMIMSHFPASLPPVTIEIQSTIPMASGLGSGAAVATALVRALNSITHQSMSPEALNQIIFDIEKLHHGTPSGIDNTVIVYEQPVYFVRGQPIERLSIGQPFTLLIGDTGRTALTRDSVGDVRRLYEQQPDFITPLLDQIGAIAHQAREAIRTGDIDEIGHLMNINHTYLQQITVSSPELDTLVEAARQAGASGAKLSGGGRGGNMIALVTANYAGAVREALARAGAARIHETQVGTPC